jgi:hypothetical protein
MRNWVLSHLMWNPELDETKLFDEFLNGYYGTETAPIVKEYWNILLDAAEKSNVKVDCFKTTTLDWLDTVTLNKCVQLMNQAVKSAKDKDLRNKLRREKLPIDFVQLKEYHSRKKQAELRGLPFTELTDPQTALDDFFARCKEFGVWAVRERDTKETFAEFEQEVRHQFNRTDSVPDFCKNIPENSWYEIQDIEFRLWGIGGATRFVADDKASNGRAVKMLGDSRTDLAACIFNNLLLDLKPVKEQSDKKTKYRVYVAVRCDAKTNDNSETALTITNPRQKISVAKISGTEYQWLDLGPVNLYPNSQIGFIPALPEIADAVYLDRIIVVRE